MLMKKVLRILSLALVLVLVLCLSALPAHAATVTDGWSKGSDGNWYYYQNGSPVSGMRKIGGSTYYFIAGMMKTNYWVMDANEDWYYFGSDGYMVTNRYIDGWWIGSDGVCN